MKKSIPFPDWYDTQFSTVIVQFSQIIFFFKKTQDTSKGYICSSVES